MAPLAPPPSGRRDYAVVTLAYWADTLVDGALRTLVLFHFHSIGYSAWQVAQLFLLYELFGVFTNLFGGPLAARFGFRAALLLGLGAQLAALALLGALPAAALTPGWVMASQALSGIAKDLTKLGSKSAVKLAAGEGGGRLYRWVTALTGSKNALKGVGFFLGAALLSACGFRVAIALLAIPVAAGLALAALALGRAMGVSKAGAKFEGLLSPLRAVNLLAVARFFLFGARDVWFVVGVPVFLSSVLGWAFWQSGAFMALWVIGYGAVQAATPALLRARHAEGPGGPLAARLAAGLALIPVGLALALRAGLAPGPVLVGGLALFGVVFALNSAVHSYLILACTDHDRVARSVGLYYMANACGRLAGTVLSGALYQWGGLGPCLWASAIFLLVAGGITLALPRASAPAGLRIPDGGGD